jgi:ubiquinone/menaquinone biosynthesis C-methylase UbiE
MKDIVTNRKKLGIGQKLKMMSIVLTENGLAWTALFGLYYANSSLAEWAFGKMSDRRLKSNLPGLNSRRLNAEIWHNWNWEHAGEEWTLSDEWKNSLINQVLLKNVKEGGTNLEIGPGGGRWTEILQKISGKLIGVDISAKCIEVCREKFAAYDNVEFFVNDGARLDAVADSSIDSVWSFDVFVHINSTEVEKYVQEFRRVMKPGSRAVIHHGQLGGKAGGWRSDLTTETLNQILARNGFAVIEQFTKWTDNGQEFPVGKYDDQITIFERSTEAGQ